MKKLALSVLIVLLPALVYLMFFFSNDPHDYFGLKDPPADFDSLIGHMLDLRRGDYDALLLGDSRTARIDVDELDRETGLRFKNMSFAGCTIEEYTKLFWWAKEEGIPLKRVVIVTSFYATNQMLQKDRVTSTNKLIQNPVTYAFSKDNFMDMLEKLRDDNYGYPTIEAVYTAEEKAANFETYRKSLANMLSGYQYAPDAVTELEEMCDYCMSNDIEVYIVLPAWWQGYYDELEAAGLTEQLDALKSELSTHAPVYDLEYPSCPLNENYDDFRDYTHARGATFSLLSKLISNSSFQYAKIWKNGVVLN